MVEIRAPVKVEQFGDRVREVMWMIGQRMLEMEMPGKRRRLERFEDVVNEDMQKVGVKVEETGNDMVW